MRKSLKALAAAAAVFLTACGSSSAWYSVRTGRNERAGTDKTGTDKTGAGGGHRQLRGRGGGDNRRGGRSDGNFYRAGGGQRPGDRKLSVSEGNGRGYTD